VFHASSLRPWRAAYGFLSARAHFPKPRAKAGGSNPSRAYKKIPSRHTRESARQKGLPARLSRRDSSLRVSSVNIDFRRSKSLKRPLQLRHPKPTTARGGCQ